MQARPYDGTACLDLKTWWRDSPVLHATCASHLSSVVNKTMRPISSSSSRPAGGAPRTSRRRRLCLAATLVMGAVAGTAAMHQPHRPFDAEVTPEGGIRELKVDEALAGEWGYRLLEPYMVYNESHTTTNNHDPWFPGCPVFDNLNKVASFGCNFIRLNKDVLTAFWVDFSKTASTTRPLNPNGLLPQILADNRPNPPRQVDRMTVYAERPTYYYCYRLILLMYSIAFAYERSNMQYSLPKLVDDWDQERWYMVKYLKPRNINRVELKGRQSPIAVSMMKGDRMMIVIRGTIWTEEWCKDFQYKWANDPQTLFPGKTHEGMYSVFIDFYKELEEEVELKKPAHVLVTGHSLGAGLANMIGLRLENNMQHNTRVDVVGFGGPNTGDIDFAEPFRKTVNSRHLIFLGRGNYPHPHMYTAGDITAQYTCEPYPGCDVLATGPFGEFYKYVRPHNQVPFYAEEMPNPKKWNEVSNIRRIIPSTKRVIASHVCSYICWTSQAVGDLDSRCYFADEEGRPDLPQTYYCDVSQVPI